MMQQTTEFYLDANNEQLWHNNESIVLTPKAFTLLSYLAQRQDQLVTKQELLEAVWPNSCVVEDSVKHYIAEVRRLLDDDPRHPHFIETVRGRGYRFIGVLPNVSSTSLPVASLSAFTLNTHPADGLSSEPHLFGQSKTPLYISLATALVVTLIALWWWTERTAVKNVSPPLSSSNALIEETPSIAVLPFTNFSQNPQEEDFADGMLEDLITDLSKISGLLVAAHNSLLAYQGQQTDIKKKALELGVRYILEGSVHKVAEQVRINVQLVDSRSGHLVWAERYDRHLSNIFELQDEIGGKIVTALAITLSVEEPQLLTQSNIVNP